MALPVDIDGTWGDSAGALDGGELRRADAAMFAGDSSASGARGGVVRHGDTSLAVTVDGSDVVTVQPGSYVAPGNAVTGTGVWRYGLSAATTGSLAARNATNPRIDLVIARALDTSVVGSHGAYKGRIEIITGTPAGSPSVPSLPTMAVELARITVPNTGGGAASVDSSHRTYATAIGGEIIVPTSSMLPASAATYQRARALDTGVPYVWTGSLWAPESVYVTDSASGVETTTNAAWTTEANDVTVTFTAPITGRVRVAAAVYIGSLVEADTGNHYWGLKLSGGTVRDPLDDETISVARGTLGRFGISYVLPGLTPGTSYTLTSAYKIVGTVSSAYRATRRVDVTDA